MSTKLLEVRNISDHDVTLECETGKVTLKPGQSIKNLMVENKDIPALAPDLKVRARLHD